MIRRPFRTFSGALALSGALAGAVTLAQTQAPAPAGSPFAEPLLEQLRPGQHREAYIAQIVGPLRLLDTNGDGLDPQDAAREQTLARTRERARLAEQLLAMDYNGDLTVTRAEVLEFTGGPEDRRAATADAALARFDTDGDGTATLAEAFAAMPEPRRGSGTNAAALLALDPNSDGRLTAPELTAIAARTFDYFDADRSGTLSSDEAGAIRAEQRLVRQIREKREAGCSFAAPSPGARFIAYSPYGGQTISTVFVGSQDIETGVIDVTVTPGKEPLFLVLKTHDSVIWRFTGATDRIERVVAATYASVRRTGSGGAGGSSAVGVIGVPRGRVQITGSDCLPRLEDRQEIAAGVPQETLTALFSRKPDMIGAENPIGTLTLPALTIARFDARVMREPLPGFDPAVWEEAMRFAPGGVSQVNAGAVIAAEPVGDYAVLPNIFGLAQLVASGHLTFEGPPHSRKFTLQKPLVRWPAEMNGALSAAFVKPEGIPMPPGTLGHSCVLTPEQGAKANWERVCREAGVRPVETVRESEDRLRR